MKLSELKPCAVCGGKIVPLWYVLRFSIAMLNRNATNSTMGIAQHFGGLGNPGALAVAEAMSPDSECVTVAGDKEPGLMTELFICQGCFLGAPLDMAVLMERARDTDDVAP